ncbi:MAG: ABC transporter permease, partial [Planctomycetes bacterium]|nr:ABC transporter permease [Planctomycetota bacterium]
IVAPPSGERGVGRALLATGAALSAISAVVFFVLPSALLSGNPSLIGSIVLALLVLLLFGFTLLALGLQPAVERALLAAFGWAFGPAGELAGRNLARQRRRSTTTALLFALSVAFVLFLSSLVALFSRLASTFIEHRLGAELRMTVAGPVEPGLAAALAQVPGVTAVSEVTVVMPRTREGVAYDVIASDVVGMKRLWVVPCAADAALEQVLYLTHARFAEGDASALAQVCGWQPTPGADPPEEPPVVVCQALARHLNVGHGDPLELAFHLAGRRRVARYRIVAVAESLPGFHNFRAREGNAQGAGLLLPRAAFAEMTAGTPARALVHVFLARGGPEAAARVRADLALRYRLMVQSASEERRESEGLYWATQVLFALLLCLAVTIAVFGLVASTTSGVAERRREVAVLKAVGLRRGQLFRMFAAESVLLTVGAGTLGSGIGFVAAWLFVRQASVLIELPVVFTLPVLTLAATLVVSVVAGLAAARIATHGLLGRPVAEILRG